MFLSELPVLIFFALDQYEHRNGDLWSNVTSLDSSMRLMYAIKHSLTYWFAYLYGGLAQLIATLVPVSTGLGDRIGVQLPAREIYLSLTNYPGQLSLAIPPWVGAMSTIQRAVMLGDWGVQADMVLFASNTVWSISERVRGVYA